MNRPDLYQLPKPAPEGVSSWVRTSFGLGVGMLVLGVLVAGVAGGSVLSAVMGGAHQVQFPGTSNLKLKAGLHVGVAAPSFAGNTDGVFVTVTDSSTGESIPVRTGADVNVLVSGPAMGRPLFQFETYDKGSYTLTGVVSSGGDSVPVMILHESLGRTRSDLVVGVVASALLVAAGIYFLLLSRKWKKKEKAKDLKK